MTTTTHGHVWELDDKGEQTLHDVWTGDISSYHDIGYFCTACRLTFCCGCADNDNVEPCEPIDRQERRP